MGRLDMEEDVSRDLLTIADLLERMPPPDRLRPARFYEQKNALAMTLRAIARGQPNTMPRQRAARLRWWRA